MSTPSPALKVNELLDKVNLLLEGDRRNISSIDVARIEREAKQLISSTAGPVWVILGMIAMLKRDYEGMHYAFSNAERISPNDPVLQMNCSTTLLHVGFFTEAVKRMWDLAQKSRDNLTILQDAKKTFAIAYDLKKVKIVSKWLDLLHPDIPPNFEFYAKIDRHLSLLASKGVSSKDITAQWAVAYRLIEHQYANELSLNLERAIEEDGSLYIDVGIPDTPSAAADLNFEIAGALATNFENLMLDVLLVTTNPERKTVEVEV